MSIYILTAAAIILLCLMLNKLSGKLGVPTLALFILLGMLFGSDGLLKIHFDDYVTTERICTVALIFIIFYGGFDTSWRQARPVALKAGLLSSLGVLLTAGLTGAFCHYAMGFAFWESMLIGAIISSTDAASVFSILRSKRLGLKNGTASMLEIESGSNDPFAYMLTLLVLSVMKGSFDSQALPLMLVQQVLLGAACGAGTGAVSAWALRRFKLTVEGFDTVLVFGMALIAYAGADSLGGNGYLSVYLFGIVLGNSPLKNKKTLVHFFNGLTGLMQILIFFLMGLLSFPSQLLHICLPALGIALFLTFVARPLSVFAILTPFRCPLNQQLLVSWTGLRGAASIVFAIMATVDPAHTNNDVFHITFFIVLFSIFLQGSLLPFMARRLHMIDDNANVMKTFSDYTEEVPLQCIKITVGEAHPWANIRVRDICSTPGMLLAMILRDKERLIPHGDTLLLPGDTVFITALSTGDKEELHLAEIPIDKDNTWIGSTLRDIPADDERLIIAIQRKNEVVIPNGQTVIRLNDVLLVSRAG